MISGYKDIFINPITKKYFERTTMDDIYSLYRFDRELRSIFLKYILIAERSIKSSLSYNFFETYGELQTVYSEKKAGQAYFEYDGISRKLDENNSIKSVRCSVPIKKSMIK